MSRICMHVKFVRFLNEILHVPRNRRWKKLRPKILYHGPSLVKEHIPKWLLDGHSRPPRSGLLPHSAVTRHLISNDCDRVNVRQRFSVLFSSQSSFILKLLESLAIKRFSPDLCVQKDFVIDLMLPW